MSRPLQRAVRPISDFKLSVARGEIDGLDAVRKFGANADIDTAAGEDIWEVGGNIPYPTEGQALQVISTFATDAPADTGARTITIEGIDDSWALMSETLNMNGDEEAYPLGDNWLRIFRAYVATAGSNLTNNGDITIAIDGGATLAKITAGNGQTLMATYTTSAAYKAYVYGFYASLTGGNPSGASITTQLFIRENAHIATSPWRLKHQQGLAVAGTSRFYHEFPFPIEVPAKSDIRLHAFGASANDMKVEGGFDLILEEVGTVQKYTVSR